MDKRHTVAFPRLVDAAYLVPRGFSVLYNIEPDNRIDILVDEKAVAIPFYRRRTVHRGMHQLYFEVPYRQAETGR